MNKLLLLMLSILLNTGVVEAGAVTIPNTFAAGTTSSAGQVNANFTAVKIAVDDNNTRVTALFAGVVPAGSMLPFAGAAAPANWLLCNGAAVSRTTYANLFTAIGIAWGSGNGTTTFNLPDLRGRFVRGVAAGSTSDPDRAARTAIQLGGNAGDAVGSYQGDTFRSHTHFSPYKQNGNGGPAGNAYGGTGNINRSVYSTSAAGGNETRPVNVYATYIIKF